MTSEGFNSRLASSSSHNDAAQLTTASYALSARGASHAHAALQQRLQRVYNLLERVRWEWQCIEQ